MDKFADLFNKLKGKIKFQTKYNCNFDHPSHRYIVVKDYRGYKLEIEDLVDLVSIGVKINSELAFAINRPDVLFSYRMPAQLADAPCQLYVRDETNAIFGDDFLMRRFLRSLLILLERFKLSFHEGAYFYRNYVQFFFDMSRSLEEMVDDVVNFINDNNEVFKKTSKNKLSIDKMPRNLRLLLPLVEKYAISDDVLREQLEGELNGEEKHNLIDTVVPLMGEINAFLDSFKDLPLNDEAVGLGDLAELVSELMLHS